MRLLSELDTTSLPRDFVWGAATSSYQVEGGFASGNRGRCIWDDFCELPGTIADGTKGGIGIDHVRRLDEDVRLMASLGLQSYRFSISWPRVRPGGQGPVNLAGLDFYDRLIDGLLEHGMTPNATLYHWDLPSELQAEGGWTSPRTVELFAEYAALVAQKYGDRVKLWAPINEPWCVAYLGHLVGEHAPGLRSISSTIMSAHQLVRAHALASGAIKSMVSDAHVGPVLNLGNQVFIGDRTPEVEADLALVDGLVNRWWLEGMLRGEYPQDVLELFARLGGIELDAGEIAKDQIGNDWVGLNYYSAQGFTNGEGLAVFPGTKHVDGIALSDDKTDMGWSITPDGIGATLRMIHGFAPGLPVYVTENGACFNDGPDASGIVTDDRREAYLARYLEQVIAASRDGVNVRGYYVWSLFDNFEWAFGFAKRFGVVHVDYEDFTRTPKLSARSYGRLIAQHAAHQGAHV